MIRLIAQPGRQALHFLPGTWWEHGWPEPPCVWDGVEALKTLSSQQNRISFDIQLQDARCILIEYLVSHTFVPRQREEVVDRLLERTEGIA